MKEIQLTQGYVALVDDDDFEKVSKFKWYADVYRRKDGKIKVIYARRNISKDNGVNTTQLMHCFIMEVSGVDHKDHNGLNNQRDNIRTATHLQNNRNTRLNARSTSGIKGVRWCASRGKWRAEICVNNKAIHLGYFLDSEEASKAYDDAALMYHKEFALTNASMTISA